MSIPTPLLPPVTAPLILRIISPLPSAWAFIPAELEPALATTAPEVVIDISPEPVFIASIPSPACAVTMPLVVIVELPLPAFSNRIPVADPVTAATAISTVVPLDEFLANTPCLLVPEPTTVFEAFTVIVPVLVCPA